MVIIGIAFYKMNQLNERITQLSMEVRNKAEIKTDNQTNYFDFVTNFEKELKNLNNDNSITIDRKILVDQQDEGYRFGYLGAYIDENNDAYIKLTKNSTLYAKYGEKYKVDSNVLNLYNAYDGNGGFSDIIFIKKDGTAYKVSTVNGKEIKYEKITNVKNAVTVIPYTETDNSSGAGGYSYLIIDNNGNVVSNGK